jgi:hypothetical protein
VRETFRREAIGHISPAEAEANHYRATSPPESLQLAEPNLHRTRGGSCCGKTMDKIE